MRLYCNKVVTFPRRSIYRLYYVTHVQLSLNCSIEIIAVQDSGAVQGQRLTISSLVPAESQFKSASGRDLAHPVDPMAGVAPSLNFGFLSSPLPASSGKDPAFPNMPGTGVPGLSSVHGMQGGKCRLRAWGLHVRMGEHEN